MEYNKGTFANFHKGKAGSQIETTVVKKNLSMLCCFVPVYVPTRGIRLFPHVG